MKRNSIIGASLTLLTATVLSGACSAQTPSAEPKEEKLSIAENTQAQACSKLLDKTYSIPKSLKAHLGPWESCVRTGYEATDYGTEKTYVISWGDVKLTVEFRVPETGIYVVETQGESPLTPDWFQTAKDEMISPFFKINWKQDAFPGPRSQHFTSAEEGHNGQVWIERDAQGAITWMRFSYAL